MTDSEWTKTLALFEESLGRLKTMEPAEPAPSVKFCRESAHRTLGHLTACQAAWLPLLEMIQAGAPTGVVPICPEPLFTKLGFDISPWGELIARFESDRAQWRKVLEQVDLTRQIATKYRIHTAQTLTKAMASHEKRHLDDLTRPRV